jgi:hypothetical protein
MSLGFSKLSGALIAVATLLAAPAAYAFTIENGSGGATAGANLMAPSPFNDPVKKDNDPNGGTRSQFGGSTVYIGPAGSSVDRDFQTGVNRMFSPLGRPPN